MHSQRSKNANWWINKNEEGGSGTALGIPAVTGHWAPPERTAWDEDMKVTPNGPSLPQSPMEHHCSSKTVVASQNSPKTSSSMIACS